MKYIYLCVELLILRIPGSVYFNMFKRFKLFHITSTSIVALNLTVNLFDIFACCIVLTRMNKMCVIIV